MNADMLKLACTNIRASMRANMLATLVPVVWAASPEPVPAPLTASGSAPPLAASPATPVRVGLVEFCVTAQAQDAQHQAARYALQAAEERIPLARAPLLPSVSWSANSSRQAGVASFSDGPPVDRDPSSWSWSVQITQPLVRGALWAGYTQAQRQVAQAESVWAQAQQDLILRCAQAYLDTQLAAENVRAFDAQLRAMQAQLDVAQRNLDVGTGTVMDVQEARAKHSLTRAQRIGASGELAARQAELERMTGQAVALPSVRLARVLSAPTEWNADDLPNLVQRNPQVQAQQMAWESAALEVTRLEREHWPTLDLTANLATNTTNGTLSSPADMASRVQSHSIGLQLTVPLYSGGATQARVREAIALQDKAVGELVSAQRMARTQALQAYLGFGTGLAQVDALQVGVQAAEAAVQSNIIGYRIGTRVNPDVLNAQQQLYATQRDLYKARTESVMQALKLKAALGALQMQDLQGVEQLMEAL